MRCADRERPRGGAGRAQVQPPGHAARRGPRQHLQVVHYVTCTVHYFHSYCTTLQYTIILSTPAGSTHYNTITVYHRSSTPLLQYIIFSTHAGSAYYFRCVQYTLRTVQQTYIYHIFNPFKQFAVNTVQNTTLYSMPQVHYTTVQDTVQSTKHE